MIGDYIEDPGPVNGLEGLRIGMLESDLSQMKRITHGVLNRIRKCAEVFEA